MKLMFSQGGIVHHLLQFLVKCLKFRLFVDVPSNLIVLLCVELLQLVEGLAMRDTVSIGIFLLFLTLHLTTHRLVQQTVVSHLVNLLSIQFSHP